LCRLFSAAVATLFWLNSALPASANSGYPCKPHEDPWIEVVRLHNILKFWCGRRTVAAYDVALGKPGFETPLGSFWIQRLVPDPTFVNPFTRAEIPPGRRNPLGVRFIGFNYDVARDVYTGLHGTTEESERLIGTNVSHGCVRMRNQDILQVYTWVSTFMEETKANVIIWIRETPFEGSSE
jgi:hypothetical protein